MKKIFVLLLLFAGNAAFAQDYAPLPQVGVRRYFTNAAGYLRGIRVDSVVQEAGHKRYVTFRTPRGLNASGHLTDSNGACWVGKDVRAYANGDWHFPNVAGDTLILKTEAPLGETWAFYTDTTSRWFEAKVIATDTQTVFGTLDSVKIIELTAKAGTTALPVDSITGFRIVLSKAHGFAEVPDLYLFPYTHIRGSLSLQDFWYRKFNDLGSPPSPYKMRFRQLPHRLPTEREMCDFVTGDIFSTKSSIGSGGTVHYTTYTNSQVLSRQAASNHDLYTLGKFGQLIDYHNPTKTFTDTATLQVADVPIVDTLFMPEEFIPMNSYLSAYATTYVFGADINWCMPGLRIEQRIKEGRGLYVMDYFLTPEQRNFKQGIGMYHNQWANESTETYYWAIEGFKRGTVVCGSLVTGIAVPPSFEPAFTLYPQPATTEVFINAPRLRYPATVSIQNLQGQLLSKQLLLSAGKGVSVAGLPAGLYLLSVTDASRNSAVQKLMIGSN